MANQLKVMSGARSCVLLTVTAIVIVTLFLFGVTDMGSVAPNERAAV